MNEKDFFGVVVKLLKAYLNNAINASELVKRYDNIITDKEFPWDLDNDKIEALDEFQNEISLFVDIQNGEKDIKVILANKN